MNLELDGRVVLVTGGSDGLGAATARALISEGARVGICARDRQRLLETATSLREAGGDVLAVGADVTIAKDIDAFVTAALARWGRIDGLVNNAGTSAAGDFMLVTDEEWRQDLDLKLFAAVRMSRLVYDSLAASGAGAVVNVLNIGAKAPRKMSLPTSVSRAAGMALTKALSREWGPAGIRVNAVLVGLIESGQWIRRAQAESVSPQELYARMVRSLDIPLARVGRAEEFADLVVFLLSARSSYLTGTAINVDGGASPVV